MPPKEHSDVKYMILDSESGEWSELGEITSSDFTELDEDYLRSVKNFSMTVTMSLISNNERRRRGMKPIRWRTLNKWRLTRRQHAHT